MTESERRKMMDLEAYMEELRDALGLIGYRCGNVHHGKKDKHNDRTACPVVARIDALLDVIL